MLAESAERGFPRARGTPVRNASNLIDEQPAAVLGPMVGRAEDMQRSGTLPKYRYKVRAVPIEYFRERRDEAAGRERDLARAVTCECLPGE